MAELQYYCTMNRSASNLFLLLLFISTISFVLLCGRQATSDYHNDGDRSSSSYMRTGIGPPPHRPMIQSTAVSEEATVIETQAKSETEVYKKKRRKRQKSRRMSVNNTGNNQSKPSNSRTVPFSDDAPFSWAACLVMRDEFMILPEWLAYHYETMPLRRLILALDPFRKLGPDFIVDAYKKIGLDITVWTVDDYFVPGKKWTQQKEVPSNISGFHQYQFHLWRQNSFLTSCLRVMKREQRSWVMIIDTDEYIAFNHYDPTEGIPWHCSNLETGNQTNRSAMIQTCAQQYHRRQVSRTKGDPRTRLPTIGKPNSTVAHYFARQFGNITDWVPEHARPCTVLPRNLFGAQESSDNDTAPSTFHHHFDTLRYRQHGPWQNNMAGKSIVDVSKYNPLKAEYKVRNPHKVLPGDLCNGGPFVRHSESILRVHHYTGSPEVFLARGKSLDDFVDRQPEVVGEGVPLLTGWLESFSARVGTELALNLTIRLQQQAFEHYAAVYGNFPEPPANLSLVIAEAQQRKRNSTNSDSIV